MSLCGIFTGKLVKPEVHTISEVAEATGKSRATVEREIARQRNPEPEIEEEDIPVENETQLPAKRPKNSSSVNKILKL